ncbi:hypothetical protein [Sphingomonas sp.]|uniref:alpha/beta hydrolase family esterase n=1 Tax=Sphingomonas sp. TaxID=28214 RepID=UPI0025EC0DF2|nr:hypothetical protein [Sphingomonas sp.]
MRARRAAWALAGALMLAAAPATAQGLEARTLPVAGTTRSYMLYVSPACRLPRARCPLVLGFHGGGLRAVSGRQLAQSGDFVAAAARRDVVMAFPDAIASNWNDGRPGIGGGVDDVGFVRALIAAIQAELPGVDRARTYATGMSNGGHLSFRLACEMAGSITAIAPVAATLSVALSQRCAPVQPVPVLNILGEQDRVSPYGGGEIMGGRGMVLSAAQTLAFWGRANRCTGAVSETRAGPVTTRRYSRCAGGVEVRQISLADGGHSWPGHPGARFLARLVGPTSMSIDATATIFDFFGIAERKGRP